MSEGATRSATTGRPANGLRSMALNASAIRGGWPVGAGSRAVDAMQVCRYMHQGSVYFIARANGCQGQWLPGTQVL